MEENKTMFDAHQLQQQQLDEAIKQKIFMEKSVSVGEGEDNWSIMPDNFRERRDLEQYFFTKNVIDNLMNTFIMAVDNPEELEKKLCLVCAPSLAKAFYDTHGLKITICDIDERFKDLPGFHYYDLQDPKAFPNEFEYILFDPPFFYISLEQMSKAIQVLANGKKDIKLLMSFMIRDEQQVKSAFKMFNLTKTMYKLEYATVEPNRWENYGLYSNVDLPMIKRLKKSEKKHFL